MISELRLGRLNVDQILIAAKFGDRDCMFIAEQLGLEFVLIESAEDIWSEIKNCGAESVLLCYMTLIKLFEHREDGWRLQSSQKLFEEAKILLVEPTNGLQVAKSLSNYFELNSQGRLIIKAGATFLSEEVSVLRMIYEDISDIQYLKYVSQVVIPCVLGETSVDEVAWQDFQFEKGLLFKFWDWSLSQFSKLYKR